jgi:hypothetical protein
MTTLETILFFTIVILLAVAAAIHGYVVSMVYFDNRRDRERRDPQNMGLLE